MQTTGVKSKSRSRISGTQREWYNWLTTHVPSSIRKGVSDAFNTMRKKVVKLYSGKEEEEDQWYDARENFSDEDGQWYDSNPGEDLMKPILTKRGIKNKVKKYVINPNGSYDPVHFLDITRDEVEAFINSETEPRNVNMSLACEMVRNDPKTEEEVSVVAHFRSKTHKLIEQKELLKQKGVYPYEYMDGFERLEETRLPPKEKFFNKLSNENISDVEYGRAQDVWNAFNMKTMRNYHDLYLKTDVLLLADVMKKK
ncbi:Hypothetical predicted protein [Paramuricea clavata]|uniref:Uncharacterized protein n=1 Tax=Paramuricea clavata TaxID=317549 RepID=A0A6S7FUH5_PARCT|nr:Hypothetical predicted protein [Paramuricea clavata]